MAILFFAIFVRTAKMAAWICLINVFAVVFCHALPGTFARSHHSAKQHSHEVLNKRLLIDSFGSPVEGKSML